MAMKAMAATKTMKDAKAMKAAKCSNAMKAAECSQAAECSKDAKKMKPTERWNFLKSFLEHAKFCDDESVEKDYAIKDSKEQVEWEPVVLGYFWKNGRVKFGYVMIEKEKIEKFGYVNRPRAIDTRGGGGAVDGVFTTDKIQQPAVAGVQRITKTATRGGGGAVDGVQD